MSKKELMKKSKKLTFEEANKIAKKISKRKFSISKSQKKSIINEIVKSLVNK